MKGGGAMETPLRCWLILGMPWELYKRNLDLCNNPAIPLVYINTEEMKLSLQKKDQLCHVHWNFINGRQSLEII